MSNAIDPSALFHYIETAPRDGRKIIVRDAAEGMGPYVMYWDRVMKVWRDPDNVMIWSEANGCGPTEWCSIN